MTRPALLVLVAATAVLLATAPAADAGFTIRYSDSHLRIFGSFGGWPSGCWPASYYYLPSGYGYYPAYYPTYRYYVPYRATLPVLSLGGLPYIPPGTIYSLDRSSYRSYSRYYYPSYYGYGYWPGYSFTGAYLATAPSVGRTLQTVASASAESPRNETKVVVQVITQPASQTTVTVGDGSWARNEWRVPVVVTTSASATAGAAVQPAAATSGATGKPAATTAATTQPPPAQATEKKPEPAKVTPADTAESYLALLLRGDDDQREEAAKELKRFNTPDVVAGLSDALRKDGEDDVRQEAAKSLGAMLAYRALPALWQAAREDTDGNVRSTARDSALKIEAYYDVKKK